jgi:ribosomal protein S18 acetylase RimI-like enzyme
MDIKVFKKDQLEKNLNELENALEFFNYGDKEWCEKVVLGSQSFAIATDNKEFVGFGRTVGDGVRFTYIVDLNIRKSYQRKGFGLKLVQTLAKNSHTNFIELTNDPKFPWLKDFYLKAGFKLDEGANVFYWPKKLK